MSQRMGQLNLEVRSRKVDHKQEEQFEGLRGECSRYGIQV